MFTKEVYGLTLSQAAADAMFPNISGVRYRNDETFVATLRALLYNRVKAGESILLNRSSSRYTTRDINSNASETVIRACLRGHDILDDIGGVLQIHSLDGVADDNDAMFAMLDRGALNTVFSGYVEIPEVSKFLDQKRLRTRFYVKEENNSAIVFVERLDVKKWHLLQSFIPRYFPALFKELPLIESEIKLLKTLTNRYAPAYEECIEEFAKQFDFRSIYIRNSLNGFENESERRKLQSVKNQIADKRYEIENLHALFKRYYQEINELTTTELGLIEKLNRAQNGEVEDSELVEYFLCNKSLNLVSAYNGMIEFIVTTTISGYDPDLFESIIENRKSFFYRDCYDDIGAKYENPDLTDDRIELLMRAIFEKQILKLRVCAIYYLNFENGDFGAKKFYDYPADILKTHTPNQHIQHYACLGNNRPIIGDAMVNRDYIAAISACCASAGNMNMSESNTGTFFMQKIGALDVGKIIQMPDGSCMTPVDAAKWLEEQNAKTEG